LLVPLIAAQNNAIGLYPVHYLMITFFELTGNIGKNAMELAHAIG
jgi:hypothetical protein